MNLEMNIQANPWYSLGYEYGFTDHFTQYTDINTGEETYDYIWKDEQGRTVACLLGFRLP